MKNWVNHSIGFTAALIALAGTVWAQADPANRAGAELPAPAATASLEQSVNKPHDDSYVIGDDDVLTISVWKQPDISRSTSVRSDGRISLPLVGEVQAAGQTPLQLETDITEKLRTYIADPEVTVMVQEINSEKFNILGQVAKPGSYSLTRATTVLDAIANAGGFRDFAKQKSVYILRENLSGGESRLAFNYKDVIKGKNMAQNIELKPGDTIVVP